MVTLEQRKRASFETGRGAGRGAGRGVVRGALRGATTAAAMVLLLGGAGVLGAETRVQTEIESFAATVWTGEELGLTGLTRGTVDFRSAGDRNVQSRLQLRLTLLEDSSGASSPAFLEVPRASIRFRFPLTEEYSMRVTTGRDRLSWGLGSLFNAADLIFGADGRSTADFTRSEDVRDETTWLLALYFPVGALGYLEAVALPPLPELSLGGTANAAQDYPDDPDGSPSTGTTGNGATAVAPAADSRAGLRLHSSAGPLTVEPSWLYDGSAGVHRTAIALQGSLGADLYGAAALHLPEDGPPPGRGRIGHVLEDYSLLSLGAFYLFPIGRDHTLAARLEALITPAGAWNDLRNPEAGYAVQLHPELVWGAGRTVQVIGRGLVSPIDASAEITGGVAWNVFQGFHMLAFVSVQAGDDTSVYGWGRAESATLALGFRYLY
ncbi:MAG: hypothetical protein EA427_10955 [Spirochaetaceae bacterium]|nr:MAG: hypothetical protein EA427_10955 [Spirochaetaceae bacterium]